MTPSETISKFRASPWVTYDPPASTSQSQSQNHPSDDEMDEDVDMDAPQISTLREDDSPPPPPPPPPSQSPKKAASTRKTKPLPKSKKPIDWAQIRNSVAERNSPGSEDEPDEPEEEEDQLIDDDDDDDIPKPSPVPTPSSARSTADPSQKKKAAVKRKPRKSEKRPPDAAEKKTREKIPQTSGAPHLVPPTMSWFEANPAEPHDGVVEPEAPVSVEGPLKIKLSVPGKKKTSPRKPPAIPRAKTKALKQKTAIPPLLIEDAGVLSEGTAASSPVTAQFEANSPEPEHEHSRPQSPQAPPSTGMPLLEETNLEGVAIPQYPLPTKPFPVQPPPKMTSGFAPALPLDRSGKKVRRWRTANREIRGIAGGRWFTRTWVGEKESEYAAALLLKAGEEKSSSGGGMTLPKLSNISISAPKAVSKLKASSSKTASLSTSAAPSRSGSSIPEGVTSAVRAPTKMRILQVAASEAGDSDMAPPPDS